MILFIHGFASCGLGLKSRAIGRYFGQAQLLAPDLQHEPAKAMEQLDGIIRQHPVTGLVGSSLGGFYATALNATHALPAVLINPAVRAHELLSGHLGVHERWCDGQPFELTPAHIQQLARLWRPVLNPARERYLVLVQKGDELLDWHDAATYYAGFDLRLLEGGSHRFEDLESHLPAIADWFAHAEKTQTAPRP